MDTGDSAGVCQSPSGLGWLPSAGTRLARSCHVAADGNAWPPPGSAAAPSALRTCSSGKAALSPPGACGPAPLPADWPADGPASTLAAATGGGCVPAVAAAGRMRMRLTLRHTVGTRMQWPDSQYTSPRSSACAVQPLRSTVAHTWPSAKCMSRISAP